MRKHVLPLNPIHLGVLAVLALPAVAAAQVPVIPGAAGYGVNTPAGRGGRVIRVTNLNAEGSGSLRACFEAAGPRVCVFDVSGTIELTEDLEISSPNIRVAGQTAPSPGITLKGAGLLISASDVLVQHLKVRVGDSPYGPPPDNRDALKIEAPLSRTVSNIVVDHCTFSWAVDEIASIWAGARDVSLLNNIFAEPLNQSIHPSDSGGIEAHGYGVILGPPDGNVTNISMVGNLMAHQVSRNPLAFSDLVMVNNVVYNYGDSAVEVANLRGTTSSSIVGNVFLRGMDSTSLPPIFVRGASNESTLLGGSRVHVADNSNGSAAGDAWSLVNVEAPVVRSLITSPGAPRWPSGLVAAPSNGVKESVLQNAGARPAERDAADARVVDSVRNRTGRFINCVSDDGTQRCSRNAGGWPASPYRTRTLALPANPDQLNPDGYTNLEKWLQKLAAEVEGRAEVPAPPRNTQLL